MTVYPFLCNTANLINEEAQCMSVEIPDVKIQSSKYPFSMSSGDFVEIYSQERGEWDAIVTSFFIDTASNVLEYLQTIYEALKPGGIWINCGPLLYHFSGMPGERSLDLTWAEIEMACETIGFKQLSKRSVRTCYANNPMSMHQNKFNIPLCVYTKSE